MNFRFTVVETSLNRAEFRWKWLRFLRYTAALGLLICLLLLGLGWAIFSGWVQSRGLAWAILGSVSAAAVIAWVCVIVAVLVDSPERRWLAGAVERIDRRLLDRLNTLLFLEQRRSEPRSEAFAVRIARQTQGVLAEKASPSPFSAGASLALVLTFVAAATTLLLLNRSYAPWQKLVAVEKAKLSPTSRPEKPFDLALPSTNNVEQDHAWGEVRITDPGTDLKVTKVDVVPLQIEAAVNQRLQRVDWFSAVNGQAEVPHDLPPPTEARYAAYQPTIYLDEMHLSDWDVVTYYAKASTEQMGAYASEVYFIEIQPFREDIQKMPGGESGQAYQTLNELSGLISRQQHVIRQTYQHLQTAAQPENLQAQDRKKLAEAESDLDEATQHLYAKMAAEMENKPIGDALDNLAKAQKSLGGASQHLGANAMPEAQNLERSALSDFVAARKMFQKAVSDHPDDFQGQPDAGQSSPAVADASKKLNQMAEFRNEAQAAQEFVRKTLDQQRALEQQARQIQNSQYPQLGSQERQLQKALDDFQGQHPEVFKGAKAQAQQARQAMTKAADALQNRNAGAGSTTQMATRELENLSQSLQNQSAAQQLADAYKLKQLLDQQARALDQRAQPDSKMSDSQLQQTARDARSTIDQLGKAAEQEPTRDAFGQPLRDALSGQNKVDLQAKLMQLEQAQEEGAKQRLAADARDKLANVSRAFDASQPKSLQAARQSDSLKPAGQQSFGQGLAELESLLKQLEKSPQLPRDQQGRQGQQALMDLQSGMRSQFGDNAEGNQLLGHLEKMLKEESVLDPEEVKKLLEQLQRFSLETTAQVAKQEDHPAVNNIDPARLPPAYRGRIQRYFEKLSEK